MSERKRRRGLLPETDAGLLARRPHRIAVLLLVVLACTGLRLVHLEADTPIGVGTGSMGSTSTRVTRRWKPATRSCSGLLAGIRFLGAPSYQSREIGRSLEEIVGNGASIAGSIAPFFALGTRMRALMVAPHSNNLEENQELEFYFLQFSETNEGRATRQLLEERSGVTIGPALYESEYAGRAISLHRLHWDEPRGDSHERRDEPRDEESRDG